MAHRYYSQRKGTNPNLRGLPLADVIDLFVQVFEQLQDEGFFSEAFGFSCTDIDHIAADRFQRREHHAVKERSRDSAVAADDDRPARLESCGPGAEARGVRRNDFRGQPSADPTTHAGDGNHQTFERGHGVQKWVDPTANRHPE